MTGSSLEIKIDVQKRLRHIARHSESDLSEVIYDYWRLIAHADNKKGNTYQMASLMTLNYLEHLYNPPDYWNDTK